MKILINDKEVEQVEYRHNLAWFEKGTNNFVGYVSKIPNKDVKYDTSEERIMLGSRLRDIRINKHKSVYSLAFDTGITRANIVLIEKGQLSVGIHQLVRICTALNVKLGELFEGM